MIDDIDAFFSDDLTVAATIVTGTSTSTERAYFDAPTQSVMSPAVLSEAVAITVRGDAVISRGSSVTIAGDGYTVSQVEYVDDGAFKRALLEAV